MRPQILNKLTISHTDEWAIEDFIEAYNDGRACDAFLPMPIYLREGDPNAWDDWCIANWGTPSDVGVIEGSCGELQDFEAVVKKENNRTVEAVCVFFSCESPPLVLYKELLARGFTLRAVYLSVDEELCGIYQDGKCYSGRLPELLVPADGDPFFGFAQKDEAVSQQPDGPKSHWHDSVAGK